MTAPPPYPEESVMMKKRRPECPKCGAKTGHRCKTTGSTGKQKKRKLHTARVKLGIKIECAADFVRILEQEGCEFNAS
jgi:hypothetical protein